MNKISIILPTRKRFESAVKSINSLFENCHNTNNFEILIAFDDDDETSFLLKDFFKSKKNIIFFSFERQFYRGLHNYYNELCNRSTGSSILLWNDDAIMKSKNWDIEIIKNHQDFLVLNPKVENMEYFWREVGVLFPIIPIKWIDITGKMSCVPACDSWIDVISKRLQVLRPLESVVISHERNDLTGNNGDETFREGLSDKFNPQFHSIFNIGFPELMNEHYTKIRNYLDDLKLS